MAQYLQSVNSSDENKISDGVCICCLAKNVQFVNFSNCKHVHIFSMLIDSKVDLNYILCYSCHRLLKKIEEFKTQVQNSIKIFNNSLQTIQPVHRSHKEFQFSKIELNSAINSEPIDVDYIENNLNETEFKFATYNTEIKIEHDYEETPEIQIKKKKRESRVTMEKKYEGMIKKVELSMEEMMAERKEEMEKKSYLNLPYKCDFCITAFDHELTFKDHMDMRHKKRPRGITCKICNSILSTKSSYDEHYKRHFRRYECVECGVKYHNVYSVLKHYNENHGRIVTQFSCDLCDFTTESNRAYRYHRDKHRSGKVECDKCGKTFVCNTGLRNHMFTIHGQSNRVYSCTLCDKVYRAKSGLAAHLAKHGPSNPAYCIPCKTHFSSEIGLKHHLKTHSKHVSDSDKPFTCNECSSKFLTKRSLQEHIDWVHLNKTEHACTKCPKVFKCRSNLTKHIGFVHEKKRMPRNKICDHCGRGFTSLTILRSHIRTHTGERPLQCARCAATFAHAAALYTHNKLIHSK